MKEQVRVVVRYIGSSADGIEFVRPTIEDAAIGMRWLALNAAYPVEFVVTFEDVADGEPESRFINPDGGKNE